MQRKYTRARPPEQRVLAKEQRDQKHLGSVGWVGEGGNQVEMPTREVGRAEWQRF